MRALVCLPILLAASGPAALQPGRWKVSTTPGTATLNGKALGDLPYTGPAAPEAICVTPAQASDPAAWLARDLPPSCTITRRSVANGRVDLTGTCPPQAEGLGRGSVRLTGRWTSTGYALRFTSSNPSENGVMGFTGIMAGKRVGDCAP